MTLMILMWNNVESRDFNVEALHEAPGITASSIPDMKWPTCLFSATSLHLIDSLASLGGKVSPNEACATYIRDQDSQIIEINRL